MALIQRQIEAAVKAKIDAMVAAGTFKAVAYDKYTVTTNRAAMMDDPEEPYLLVEFGDDIDFEGGSGHYLFTMSVYCQVEVILAEDADVADSSKLATILDAAEIALFNALVVDGDGAWGGLAEQTGPAPEYKNSVDIKATNVSAMLLVYQIRFFADSDNLETSPHS